MPRLNKKLEDHQMEFAEEYYRSLEPISNFLRRNILRLVGVAGACALLSFLICQFLVTKAYQSDALIMARTDMSSSRLEGALSSLSSGLNLGSGTSQSKQFEEVLKSRDLAARTMAILLEKGSKFKAFYGKKLKSDSMAGSSFIRKALGVNRDGDFLRLTIENEDPALSQEILTGVLEALELYIRDNILTQAKNTEVFIKERLEETKEALAKVEKKFVSGNSRVSYPEAQRELQIQSGLVDLLSKEYEMSQIDAKKNDVVIVKIDEPSLPTRPSSPKTKLAVLLSAIVGLLLGASWSLSIEGKRSLKIK
ncbi:MAG: hypothetical protein COV44_00180 [Deltaproteobacteria bacterium CG11_big_fil_rev_8_21_14_0_20_45_16]|nr:MAG: hypothetical protein COV44_00180 [Deltaproteobacteria bacterium CG11_big_fil_rev_8_21_14_0_20_45_16]